MISRVLWYLQNGLASIRLHTKFIFIIVLLFVFPLLFLFALQNINYTSLENIKTAQKESVAILHRALQSDMNVALHSVLPEFNSPVTVQVFVSSNNEYKLQYTTEDNEPLVGQNILKNTPEGGEVYIYEQTVAGNRIWYAVSKKLNEGTVIAYVSAHDLRNVDKVIANRINDLYWLLAAGLLFLLLIAYWLIKQTNWEAKYQEIQKNLSEQELLIGTITHEFRAPLTAIAGYLSFLFESNRLRSKDKAALNNIGASTQRMLHLVNDFLEVAKIQSGKLDLKLEKTAVAESVYRVISELGATAAEKKLVLRDATQKRDIVLMTDKKRLVQVLTNIVSNAIKYTEKGSVIITYDQNPLYVTIRVQDTGSGISAEDREKLFKPFSRVGGVEKTAVVGSGLGMWITKKIVETLGGTIAVESIKGVGTHVVIKFDLRKIAAKAREGIL